MPPPHDDYDTPWKNAPNRYFPEFIAFYFPLVHAGIDWRQRHEFLDQELAQVTRDAQLGRRLVDKLVRVVGHAGAPQWVLVHVDVQGGRDSGFAERIFTYNYRLYDRYRRPVASLAVLADAGARWKPDWFGCQLFGCDVRIRFPVVKLNNCRDRLAALLDDPNPFALVTAAHRLTKLLYQRDWDRQRVIDLFNIIDWMMRLPAALEAKLWQDIEQLERERAMPYVTSVERIGLERGRQEGQAMMLARLLTKRFGALPADIEYRLAGASAAQLLAWGEAVFDAATLDQVFHDG